MLYRNWLVLVILSGLIATSQLHSAGQQNASANQDAWVQLFRTAQQEMRAGDFNRAIQNFNQVLRLRPGLVEAQVNLGLAYHAVGDYRLAVTDLSQAARERPDLLPASLFLGLSYLKLGAPEKAIPALNQALSIDPTNRQARRALATAELSEDRYGQAATLFRRLAATQSRKADAWFTLGQDYLEMAKRLTGQLSTQFPDSAWSLRLAGDVLQERHLWNNAALAYRKALTVNPAQPGLHSALARVLARDGKLDESETEFKAELARRPFEEPALLGWAEVQLFKGDPQPAIDAIAKIWQLAPEFLTQNAPTFPGLAVPASGARRMISELQTTPANPPRQFILSALYGIAGDSSRARQEQLSFESSAKAAAHSGSSSPSRLACERHRERLCVEFMESQRRLAVSDLLCLGRALLILGQDEPASDAFAAVYGRNKGNDEAIYWLSRSYLRLADTCFNQLSASYPGSEQAHMLKGEALHLRQADKSAIQEYRAAERLNPNDFGVHQALGELLLGENEIAEGKSELEMALRLNPADARSLYLLGQLYVVERQPQKGIPYLEAALRYDPGLIEARPALGKAYLKMGKPAQAVAQLQASASIDRYGDLHYLLFEAYRDEGKPGLASQALARSQELRRKSAADDQAKIHPSDQE
ncbi:MAG TPA: tetratricopeptide repeat protein [Terriglobia bacterium]|nr:tetratricopeptide repeat protein [Terriglobia bacterium]